MEDWAVSLQDAQKWVDLYRELLALDTQLLRRMRSLVVAHPSPYEDYGVDVRTCVAEIQWVMARLAAWEALVPRLRGGE